MAPQSLHILLCVDCKTFQVHIVKKSNQWSCKNCSAKQTVQRVYGTGTGSECRIIVQRLNQASAEIKLAADTAIVEKLNEDFAAEEAGEHYYQEGEEADDRIGQEEASYDPDSKLETAKTSKWAVFLEKDINNSNCLD